MTGVVPIVLCCNSITSIQSIAIFLAKSQRIAKISKYCKNYYKILMVLKSIAEIAVIFSVAELKLCYSLLNFDW